VCRFITTTHQRADPAFQWPLFASAASRFDQLHHPPYSSNFVPSDFRLLRSLKLSVVSRRLRAMKVKFQDKRVWFEQLDETFVDGF